LREGRPEGEGRGQGRRLRRAARAGRSAAERRSKRPARRGPTRVKGGGGGRLGGYARIPHRGEGSGEIQGAGGALRAPIDRREEMPMRKVASATGAPVPARAATRRRAGGREREKRRPGDSSHQRLCACEATCAKRAWLTRWGKTCAKHPSPGSTRRPSPPPPPAASVRARAGGPRHLRAARCRRPTS
jgi:hypothetical protein